MDVWFVIWGGVLGRVLLALVVGASMLVMSALAMRRDTPMGRFVRSLARARRSLHGAEAGDRIVAFGRIAVDGPAAERFDDGAPCALASLETEGGFATVRGRTLYLQTKHQRMRLSGPVSIEATTHASRRRRPSMLLRLHLWRERLPAQSPVRVASLAIGERALVIGRAEKEVARDGKTYRDAPLVLAIGAGDEPIAVLGLGHVGPALVRFGLRAAAPAFVLAAIATGLAALSLARPELIDAMGGAEPLVPAHVALPLLSPWHRQDALRDVDGWLVESLWAGTVPPAPHLLEVADALEPLVPSCPRQAALAVALPGHRSEQRDGCDALVGIESSAAWASERTSRSSEDRAAMWADIVTSIERAPQVGELALTHMPPTLTEEDEWQRVAIVLRTPWPGVQMQRMGAIHLRRLAIAEALNGSQHAASLLEDAARRYAGPAEEATHTALLAVHDDARAWDRVGADFSLRDLHLREASYLDQALLAAERVVWGDHDLAYRILAPHTWARRVPLTRGLVMTMLETSASDARLADAD